jgi:hypothetical protein
MNNEKWRIRTGQWTEISVDQVSILIPMFPLAATVFWTQLLKLYIV